MSDWQDVCKFYIIRSAAAASPNSISLFIRFFPASTLLQFIKLNIGNETRFAHTHMATPTMIGEDRGEGRKATYRCLRRVA